MTSLKMNFESLVGKYLYFREASVNEGISETIFSQRAYLYVILDKIRVENIIKPFLDEKSKIAIDEYLKVVEFSKENEYTDKLYEIVKFLENLDYHLKASK